MDTATKTGIDAAKTASKRVVQKTAEATGDLIGNKIADKITSVGKTKSKEKENERQEIYVPPEIDDLKFQHHINVKYQKITNLLDTRSDVPRFITKKWIEVHDQSGSAGDRQKPSKQIRFKTSILRSDLRDFSDAYIAVAGNITIANKNNKDNYNRKLAFKNNAPFIACISKINGILINNAEDLDVVMPMYNLREYSKNYEKTTGSLWSYYKDEPKDGAVGNRNEKITTSFKDSKSFN